jgi:hypothetical protein
MGTEMSGKLNGGQENGGKLGVDENQINGRKFLVLTWSTPLTLHEFKSSRRVNHGNLRVWQNWSSRIVQVNVGKLCVLKCR